MRERREIYAGEAAEILNLTASYPGILRTQLSRFFPGRERAVLLLTDSLEKQGRIRGNGKNGYRPVCAGNSDREEDTVRCLWVLLDMTEGKEYIHMPCGFPGKIMFFSDGTEYEILSVREGEETMMSHAASGSLRKEGIPSRLVVTDTVEMMENLDIPGTVAFCTVEENGKVNYYSYRKG